MGDLTVAELSDVIGRVGTECRNSHGLGLQASFRQSASLWLRKELVNHLICCT